MSKELPYYRFTVSEWLNDDISLESYEVKGVFIDVCAWYWFKDCSIDIATLKKRFKDAIKTLESLFELGIIKVGEDGETVQIKFLDEQYDTLSNKRQKYVEAGRKGGLKRASNAQATLKQRSSYKDKDKDKDNNKNILMSELSDSDDLNEYENIALSFWELCKANMLQFGIKSTDLERAKYKSWVDPVRLSLEKDNRTTGEFREIWDFLSREIPHNGFSWRQNIQSGSKLREKFEQLLIAARNPRVQKSNKDVYENLKRKFAEEAAG